MTKPSFVVVLITAFNVVRRHPALAEQDASGPANVCDRVPWAA
ncbi:MAG: hypothetical protein ACR2QO_28610 [Acidimicrobiales bacterium]